MVTEPYRPSSKKKKDTAQARKLIAKTKDRE